MNTKEIRQKTYEDWHKAGYTTKQLNIIGYKKAREILKGRKKTDDRTRRHSQSIRTHQPADNRLRQP